ncbi:hypothetical protein ACQ4WX_09100 [Streptomyces lasalocidi]
MTGQHGLDLGTFGIYTFDFEHQSAAGIRDAVQELEGLGWPALWVPELLGREALTHAGFLLASSRTAERGQRHRPDLAPPRPLDVRRRAAARRRLPEAGTCSAWASAASPGPG